MMLHYVDSRSEYLFDFNKRMNMEPEDGLTREERGRLHRLVDMLRYLERDPVMYERGSEGPSASLHYAKLSSSQSEELVDLLRKLPSDERKIIESKLQGAVDRLAQEKEELRMRTEVIDRELEDAKSLLSAMEGQKK
jgi:peptide subunit release factor 1 (eRF1)